MKAAQHELLIIYIADETGFSEKAVYSLNQIIIDCRPDYYEFLNPDAYYIYFKSSSKNKKRAEHFLEIIRELICCNQLYSGVRVGIAHGLMIYKSNWLGHIKSAPLGGPGNEASKNIILSGELKKATLNNIFK